MGVIIKYLKKFWVVLIICFVLLFGQAMADLFLPDFMSDIVNVGIQQSGITRSTPEAVSEQGFNLITKFMDTSDKVQVDSEYTLVTSGGSGAEYEEYLRKYPLLATENIMVLNANSALTDAELDSIWGKASFTLIYWLQDMMGSPTGGGAIDQSISIADKYPELEAAVALYLGGGDDFVKYQGMAVALGDSTVNATGASFVKMFYQELGIDVAAIQSQYIWLRGLIMLLISLAGGAVSILVGFFSSRMAAGFAKRVREDLFNKVQSFSNAEFNKFSTASLITRTTNDITQVQMAIIMGIRMLCYAPILGVGAVIMALSKSASMGWIVAVACIVLVAILMGILLIALPKFKAMQKLIDRLNLVARENLSGLLVVRAFSTQEREGKRFDKANKDLTKTMMFLQKTMALLMPVLMLVMNLLVVVIIWVGSNHVADATMQVGDMMAFMQYAILIVMAVMMVAAMFTMIPRAMVSSKRIGEVLATEISINDPSEGKAFTPDKMGEIEFKNVSFGYGAAEENVLDNISFVAESGKTTAIIGSSGSGKSTLINLIPRFYDVTDGELYVNGIDVREVKQTELRDTIGYVPQKGMLLSGTIEENLKYGRTDADESVVSTAIATAQGAEFINKLPDRTQSVVAAGGANFSGGQKQRLSIARALVKEAPIYIFDDSFSALDYKTDAALRDALSINAKGSTVIVVAQRVATIRNADQIIVLEKGKIVGKGTHKQLLKSCKVYYEIASSQLSKEEL